MISRNYKLVVSDLDGTLLVNSHLPLFNLESIKKIREKNVKFCIATGRAIQSTKYLLKELESYDKENEYSILFNGSVIIENKGNKVLYFKSIDFDNVNKIFEIGNKYKVLIMMFSIEKVYVWRCDEEEFERQKQLEEILTLMEEDSNINFIQKEKIQIVKIVFGNNNYDFLLKIKNELDNVFKNEIELTFSTSQHLEINPKNSNKGEALEWLSNFLNINIEDTIAIGDNNNDLSMIEKAGLGVCVNNGIQEVKKKSKYITEKNCDEGAVKEVLDKFILNQ